MNLQTERLVCRSFKLEDLAAFAAIQADTRVMRYLGGVQSFAQSQIALLEILDHDRDSGLARFAVERRDQDGLIGYCGFKPAGDFVDLGYQYASAHWGAGFGLEAAKAVRRYGLDKLGIRNMEAGGAVANVASVRIMEQLEFQHRESLLFNGTPAVRFFDKNEEDKK